MLLTELDKCVKEDVGLLNQLRWKDFVKLKRGLRDLGSLNFEHPACQLLHHFKTCGAPIKMKTAAWTQSQLKRAI